jgi:hypothetical protein
VAWRRRPDEGTPERLCRFIPAEWPGAACVHEALGMWQDACTAWLAADSAAPPHPDPGRAGARDLVAWRSGWSRRALPFGEYGDSIDVLRETMRYHRQMPPSGSCPVSHAPRL